MAEPLFKVLPKIEPESDPILIEKLEELLELAKAGKLEEFVAVFSEDGASTYVAKPGTKIAYVTFAAAYLNHHAMNTK